MIARLGSLLAIVPFAVLAANRPPNYDALADFPDTPAFTRAGGERGVETLSIDPTAYVAHVHDTGRGAIIVKYRQRVDGIEVFRSEFNVVLTRDRKLIATSGALSGTRRLATAFSKSDDAVRVALADLDGGHVVEQHPAWFPFPDHLEPATFLVIDTGDTMYSYVIASADDRILFRKDLTEEDAQAFTYRVWADPAGVHRPYNGPQGFAGIPHPTGTNDGYQAPPVPSELITLASGPISTHDPWLGALATETSGNNVEAYVDLSSPDGLSAGDFHAGTTSAFTFDHPYDFTLSPQAARSQQEAVITQLFYDVNFFHDWYYDAGFTETAGNGQADNYGRGGVPNDSIRAEAQDYSGRNNANMTTPPDGQRPRMQMYIWDGIGRRDLRTTSGGDYVTGSAAFGPAVFNISADVVAVSPADGCAAISTPLAGKIAFIDRGTCQFVMKAANAKAAGAIGIIVGNVPTSVSPESVLTMACSASPCPGTETQLPPAFHLALSDAEALRAQLANGPIHATMQRDPAVDRDGDLDNEIVAHEWGHYLSNRLIANSSGLSAQQSRGMGEGWSDFLALLLVARAEDAAVPSDANYNGTYAAAQFVTAGGDNGPQPNGGFYFAVRRVPYSTDMTKDPLTLKHITKGNPITGALVRFAADGANNSEVHNTGEVWATMLWECYASLLRDTLGEHPRLTFADAQQRMKDYIVASLKMTPANPTLLDGRDALLAVAYANDVTDFREFWQAFAKRGAGIHAVAAQRFSTANLGAVEDFTVGANATVMAMSLDDSVTSCAADGVLDTGETGVFKMTLRNSGNARLDSTTATVASSDPRLKFDGAMTFPPTEPGQTTTGTVRVTLGNTTEVIQPTLTVSISDPALASSEAATLQPRLNAREEAEQSATDNVESTQTAWKGTGTSTAALAWHQQEIAPQSHVWQATEWPFPSDSWLISPTLVVSHIQPLRITFRQRYWFDTTTDANGNPVFQDGGVVEISADDGLTWKDIGGFASPGYGDTPLAFGVRNPLQGRRAFVGLSPGASTDDPAGSPFTSTSIDLGNAYGGQHVRIRFRSATSSVHSTAGLLGWQIDDIAISGITNLPFFGVVGDRGLCGTFDTTTAIAAKSSVITATVSAPNTPNGTVDFLENGSVIASVLLSSGVASWNAASELSAGPHTIVAKFAGSTNFKPSTSAALQIELAPPQRHRAVGR